MLITLDSLWTIVVLSLGIFVAARAVSRVYAINVMYSIRINHSLGSYFVRHLQIELVRSERVPARNDCISREEALRELVDVISVLFASILDVDAYEVIYYTLMSVSMLGLAFVNFNVFFRDDFLALTLSWPDIRYHISLTSFIEERVALKGFCMHSIPEMPVPLLLLLGRVMCLGNTIIFFRSNSYWLTSERSFAIRILGT